MLLLFIHSHGGLNERLLFAAKALYFDSLKLQWGTVDESAILSNLRCFFFFFFFCNWRAHSSALEVKRKVTEVMFGEGHGSVFHGSAGMTKKFQTVNTPMCFEQFSAMCVISCRACGKAPAGAVTSFSV